MNSRQLFLASIIFLSLSFSAAAEDRTTEKTLRLPGHRNLFNGDCTFLFGDAFVTKPDGKYDRENLHWFIDMLADCGVDTYLNNPTAQTPWYPSKLTPNILTGYKRGDREFFRRHYRVGALKERVEKAMDDNVRFLNRYVDLVDAGVDWVKEISLACRRRGISPWLSVRMNDLHGANSWEGSYMNCALQRDPRFRLSGQEINPRDGTKYIWQGLDYKHPEVRDYMLTMIRELVENYDYEGLELDWLRCPFCIDAPASPEQIEMITKWHAQVRELTQARAKQTGKPFALGVRIPCRLGQLKAVGLDIKAMVDAGLLDFVNFSNFWQTTWDVPYDQLRRELGDKVAIYGVVEAAPNWMNAFDPKAETKSFRLLSTSPELIRGNAAGKLAMGVDGIETFNFFVSDTPPHEPLADRRQARYPELRNLHRLDHLRGKPKQYALASRRGAYDFPLFELAEQVPITIEPDSKQSFRLSMCSEPADQGLELFVQIIVKRTDDQSSEIGVSFNGDWPTFAATETSDLLFPAGGFTRHVPEHRAYNFRRPVSAIRDGWNEVLVFNGRHEKKDGDGMQDNRLHVVSVELAIRKIQPL